MSPSPPLGPAGVGISPDDKGGLGGRPPRPNDDAPGSSPDDNGVHAPGTDDKGSSPGSSPDDHGVHAPGTDDKGPSTPGLVAPAGSRCSLGGDSFNDCFKLDDGVKTFFTLKGNDVLEVGLKVKSNGWAALAIGNPDAPAGASAVLAKTCGKSCSKLETVHFEGGHDLQDADKGKSKIKFSKVKGKKKKGEHEVSFEMKWPAGASTIKVTVITGVGNGPGQVTKTFTFSKEGLM